MSDTGIIAKQRAYLAQLRRILPPSAPWDAWLEKSGELPPDFDALPSHYDLPDPLQGVEKSEEWRSRREELKQLFHQWVIGSVPPPPDNLKATILSETADLNATRRNLQLSFGPGNQATLRVEVFIPNGTGPFPVFMTQSFHRDWALIALKRGYLACIYAGSDDKDDTDTFVAPYAEYDWSRITRRAWAASRCVDYLAGVPQADMSRIAITGHSRNGKLSMIASALDERFALVISSSSGAGGVLTARHFSEQHGGEGIELITRRFPDWFHPRWRFFVGREHKLPVDLHELVALSAPRPCLLSLALNDHVESTWALEQTYQAAQRVYRFLDAEPNLRMLYRPGSHEVWPLIIEQYLDWCDTHFGRGKYDFPERLIHPHNWSAWKDSQSEAFNIDDWPQRNEVPPGSTTDWERKRRDVAGHVRWMLGEEPPGARGTGEGWSYHPPHLTALLEQHTVSGVAKIGVGVGEFITGDMYVMERALNTGKKLPAILWLHPMSVSNGYVAVYRRGEAAFQTMAMAGFAVLCIDHIGHGQRIEEVEKFYTRHPRWSLLGKMVRDAGAGLDTLTRLPYIDTERIYGLGYGLGSMVGLHLAALDDRMAGFAAVCPPPPFRLDTNEDETGGIRRWSHLHMLLPRLGYFFQHERRIPYDVDDLAACLAPRPLLVVSPQLDREAPLESVTQAVDVARAVYRLYNADSQIEQQQPEAYNHFDSDAQEPVAAWLRKQMY
jgi:dienelactone hydrolase